MAACNHLNTLNLTIERLADAYVSYWKGAGWTQNSLPAILVVGLITNLSFLFTIARIPRMRTMPNLYLALQTVADIIFLLLSTMPFLLGNGNRRETRMTSSFGCFGVAFMRDICYHSSLASITFVSFDRFVAVVYPFKFRILRNKRNIAISLISIGVVASFSAAITSLDYTKHTTICLLWPDKERFANYPSIRSECLSLHPQINTWCAIYNIVWFMITIIANILFSTLEWSLNWARDLRLYSIPQTPVWQRLVIKLLSWWYATASCFYFVKCHTELRPQSEFCKTCR